MATSQSLDNMSPDSGLAASNPQLYEDILVATSSFESGCRKSQQLLKDSLSRAELFDILEDQLTPDSDDASLSSQVSDHYNDGVQISAEKKDVERNVNEHLQQFKNLDIDSEEIVGNFEGRFLISQEQVGLSDMTEQAAAFSSCSLLPEAEVQCSSHDDLLAPFPLGTEVKAMPLSDLTMHKIDKKKKHMSKSVTALNDDIAKKTADLSVTKTPQYCCRLIGVEIVPVTKSNTLPESKSVQTKVTEKGSTIFAVSPTGGRKIRTSPEKCQHKYVDGTKITACDNDSPIKRERFPLQSRENPAVVMSQVSRQRPLDSEKYTASAHRVHLSQYQEVNSSSTKMADLFLNSNSPLHLSVDNGQFSKVNDTNLLVTVTRSRQKEYDKAKHSNMRHVVDRYNVCQKALDVDPQLRDTQGDVKNFKYSNARAALIPDRISGTGIKHNGLRKDAICKPRQIEDNDPCQTTNSAHNPPNRPVVTGIVNSYCNSGNVTITSLNCRREDPGLKMMHGQTGLGNHIGEATSTNKGTSSDDRQVIAWRGGGITNAGVAHLPHSKCPNLNTQTAAAAPRPDGFNQRNGLRIESRSVDRAEMHRRTTVIQLCDNNSVILQKTLNKT